jgi:hypothetical protein
LAERGDCKAGTVAEYNPWMGFNKRKMEDARKTAVDKEATGRRATDAQVLEDAEQLIAAWDERQAKRMPMLFAPTIGAAIAAPHWWLWAAVRPAAPRTRSTCGRSTVIRTRQSQA